ncbi:hypothetical protein [Alkalicoccobacillus murimartini]|uniref:Uncharacterized protein n=1 Tax=Alkalicoccobacillus murimartini TaxID=171685 RepID=A0ABT9YJF8_9BACI|nr:hypothetical protein [Alkalicoccobacillus murimartini]MDQ0207630.1 hypothetical protein [Alkalicoccobacillus murimartini]
MKKYRWLIGVFISVVLVILGFIIPIEIDSPDDQTVIIDYTLNEYSAPACFDQAGFTNNLDDAIYSEMEDSNFSPESSCTTDEFTGTTVPLWFSLFK